MGYKIGNKNKGKGVPPADFFEVVSTDPYSSVQPLGNKETNFGIAGSRPKLSKPNITTTDISLRRRCSECWNEFSQLFSSTAVVIHANGVCSLVCIALYVALLVLTHEQKQWIIQHYTPVHVRYSKESTLYELRGGFPDTKSNLRFYGAIIGAGLHTAIGALGYVDTCIWLPTQRYTPAQHVIRMISIVCLVLSVVYCCVQASLDGDSLSKSYTQYIAAETMGDDHSELNYSVLPAVYCCSTQLPPEWISSLLFSTYSCYYNAFEDTYTPPDCVDRLNAWHEQRQRSTPTPTPPPAVASRVSTSRDACKTCGSPSPSELSSEEEDILPKLEQIEDSEGGVQFGVNITTASELINVTCHQVQCIRTQFWSVFGLTITVGGICLLNLSIMGMHWAWGRTVCDHCNISTYKQRGRFFHHQSVCTAASVQCVYCDGSFRRLHFDEHERECEKEHIERQKEYDKHKRKPDKDSFRPKNPKPDADMDDLHKPEPPKQSNCVNPSYGHSLLDEDGDVNCNLLLGDGLRQQHAAKTKLSNGTSQHITTVQDAQPINCDYCGIPLENLKTRYIHLTHKCDHFVVPCTDCAMAIPYKLLHRHQISCPLHAVPCDFCGQMILNKNLKTHLEQECDWRIIQCASCGLEMCCKDYMDPAQHRCANQFSRQNGAHPVVVEF